MIIEAIVYLLVILTVIPVALFLSSLCGDELIKDRKYFTIMAIFLIILAIVFLIFYPKVTIILSLIYLVLLLEILIYKSKKLKIK